MATHHLHVPALSTHGPLARRALLTTLASTIVFALAACGGSVESVGPDGSGGPGGGGSGAGGSGGGSAGGSGGGSGGGSAALNIEGSYDLTFTQASATFQGGSGVPTEPSPSAGKSGRLDIRSEKSSGSPVYSAVLTARWGEASTYTVKVGGSVVTLDAASNGSGAAFGGASNSGYISDTWKQITLERAADGTLTGVVHGSGEEQVSMGDEIWQGDVSGAGKLTHDTTVPEIKAALTSPQGPSTMLLPWDPIRVTLAEPLDGVTMKTSLEADVDDFSLPIAWKQGTTTSSGTTVVTGFATSWTAASGTASFVHVGGVPDPSSNVTAKSNASFTFLPLPVSAATHTFDGNTISPWGSASRVSDARCESGGCMVVGPYLHQGCGASRSGFAGLLTAPQFPPSGSGPKIHVRYRILAKPTSGTAAPSIFVPPLYVEAAATGGQTTETGLGQSDASYSALPSTIDGLTYGTAWTTADIDLPVGAQSASDPIGFAIRAGDTSGCGGGPPFPTNQVEILIDSVGLN